MIKSLNGKLIYTDAVSAVVECAGVGYGCKVTYNTLRELPQIGEKVFLYTYMAVREDAMELFGFGSVDELECFKLLITVNGVGPKAALAILSELSPNAVAFAIATGDSKTITKAQGVGPKLAQRIVLELKDKVGTVTDDEDNASINEVASAGSTDSRREAISALMALGYSQSEAASAVSKCDVSKEVEQIIKDALKHLF